MLDISGCAHLFGGEAALCGDLVRELNSRGFQVRAAIADTVGCAWGVARYGLSLPRFVIAGRAATAARVDPMLSGLGTDEVENSARLPPPIGERVGVRGQRVSINADILPLTRPLRGRPRIKSGAGSLPAGERWSKPYCLAYPSLPVLGISPLSAETLQKCSPSKPDSIGSSPARKTIGSQGGRGHELHHRLQINP